MTVEEKAYAQILVQRVKQYPRVYKYLTYENGVKMLQYNNLQFTRANKLNDKEDCHMDKVNLDFVRNTATDIHIDPNELVSKVITKHKDPINSLGICSLGSAHDNDILWTRYTLTDEVYDGICIELDLNAIINCLIKQDIKPIGLVVDYIDFVIESIPYEYFIGTKLQQYIFLTKLFATKNAAKWMDEKEVRIVLPQELGVDEKYRQIKLYKSCFKNVYLGRDVKQKQYDIIREIVEPAKYKLKIIRYN